MKIDSFVRRRGLSASFVIGAATIAAIALSGGLPHEASLAARGVADTAAPAVAPLPTASYADAVARVAPAVVTIQVEKRNQASPAALPPDDFFQRFFGPNEHGMPDLPNGREGNQRNSPVEHGLGSGVIMRSDGYIVTNNHVVDGADHVRVVLADGREFDAKVIGTDPPTDLAVVHIDAAALPTIAAADSDRVRVGDVVLAVGNPLGVGETVTMGIVSAKGRQTEVGDGSSYEDFIQTDAPINRGNSGGALVTTTGELVGINSQIMSPSGGNIGIGFAIPSNITKNVMTQLVSTGHVSRGMLGVTVQGVTSDLAKSFGLPSVHGAIVDSVTAGGPAAKAGVEPGDVVLSVNGHQIDDSNGLRNQVSALAPGSSATLTVFRHGTENTLSVTLGQMPADKAAANGPAAPAGKLGMTLQPVTPSLAERLRLPAGTTGVAVTDVDSAGAAARAGIRSGDVLVDIDGHAVRTADEVRSALAAQSTRPALAAIVRDGHKLFVALPTAG